MLRTKDYIKERQSIQIRIAEIDEEKKRLKLLLTPLNQLIAAAGAETNGHTDTPQFPCQRKGCERGGDNGFNTQGGLSMHMTKTHGTRPKK